MRKLYTLLFLGASLHGFGQSGFSTVSDATTTSGSSNTTCFQLTPPDEYKRGAVWSNQPVNLNQNFSLRARLYFGNNDADADGIAFVMQKEGTGYIGNVGAGLGYHRFDGIYPASSGPIVVPVDNPGPVPSFIIEFDTYQNGAIYGANIGDLPEDHVGFMSNSNAYHSSSTALKAPEKLNSNIEDGQWHDVAFTWNASLKTMTVVFSHTSMPAQTFTLTRDLVATIFGGDGSGVYWGFTASTGSGTRALQSVCIVQESDCGQLRTQTPGGWGGRPQGNNPASYLYANFSTVFSSGLLVGNASGNHIKLTSAAAVTAFLPSGGQAKALTTQYLNPGSSVKNTLAGHLVALTLSLGFDAANPAFGTAGTPLADMIIGSGAFAGQSVSFFMTEANRVLAGLPSSYTVQQVLQTATAINENYVDGTIDMGYLNCPNGNAGLARVRPATAEPVMEAPAKLAALPTITSGAFTLQLPDGEGRAQVQLIDMNGSLIEQRNLLLIGKGQTLSMDLSRQAKGMYIVRVVTAAGAQSVRVVRQ
jgi:hypothetical protein